MPRAEIASKQAMFTLSQLHAELAGKFLENRSAAVKIKTAMLQVEAVMQMLQPGFSVRSIAAKRRNKSNPWFKRGTLYRKALDVLRTAEQPMTATDIAWAVMAAADVKTDDKKAVQVLGQGIQASLRNHAGKGCPAD
jgi:hypothetical protein